MSYLIRPKNKLKSMYLRNQPKTKKKIFEPKTFKNFGKDNLENEMQNRIRNINNSLKHFETITIYIRNTNTLNEVGNFLNSSCKAKADDIKTQITIKIADKTIQLPQNYKIDSIAFNFLKNIFGVERVEE